MPEVLSKVPRKDGRESLQPNTCARVCVGCVSTSLLYSLWSRARHTLLTSWAFSRTKQWNLACKDGLGSADKSRVV